MKSWKKKTNQQNCSSKFIPTLNCMLAKTLAILPSSMKAGHFSDGSGKRMRDKLF